MLKISLIICTYQRPDEVRRLLEALAKQTLLPDEIIIVDGSLDDKTGKIIKEIAVTFHRRLVYILVDENDRGLTRQRNVGIKNATGEIVAFLDDDTIPNINYFEEIIVCFDRHPEAVGVGGQITTNIKWKQATTDAKPSLSVYRLEDWVRSDGIRWRLRKIFGLDSNLPPGWMPSFGHGRSAGYPPTGNDYPVEFIMGGASAWKRSLFSQIQFSHYFEGYGLYEDLDFSIRANRLGKIFVCTRAQLEHHHASGGRPDRFKYGKMVERNGWYVWRQRWPSPAVIDQVKYWAISFLLGILRLIDLRGGGPEEAFGRMVGAFSVFLNPPRE